MFSLDEIKAIVSRKVSPSHPSEIALDAIEDTNIAFGEYKKFFEGKVSVNLEIASYLNSILGNGIDSWIRLQEVYDLWHLFNNTNKGELIQCNKEPRPLSLVRFANNSAFRKSVENGLIDYISIDQIMLYLGPIPNQSGHSVFINLSDHTTHVIDTEELVELTEEEL